MKIGIDARILKTGIGRYTRNLIFQLAEASKEEDQFMVFLRSDDYKTFEVPDERFKKVLADFPPYSFAEQIEFLFVLRRYNLDLIHFTNFNVPVLWWGKYVLTVHDLIHMNHSTFGSSTRNYPYYLFKKFIYGLVIRWVARRARAVLVPSKATEQDVITHLGISQERIFVTYEGADEFLEKKKQSVPENFASILKEYKVSKPFLLYVATMYPHKNHKVLLEAFNKLIREQPELKLVLVGKVDYFSHQVQEMVDEMGLQESVIMPNFSCKDGYLPDDALEVLYRDAEVYVFPSLMEGFGIPLLEAQAFGLPVAASNLSCIPEVGGESVVYFDPTSAESMIESVNSILGNDQLQQELIDKGYKNITRFSWREMATQTYQVYNQTA